MRIKKDKNKIMFQEFEYELSSLKQDYKDYLEIDKDEHRETCGCDYCLDYFDQLEILPKKIKEVELKIEELKKELK